MRDGRLTLPVLGAAKLRRTGGYQLGCRMSHVGLLRYFGPMVSLRHVMLAAADGSHGGEKEQHLHRSHRGNTGQEPTELL